MFIMYGVASSKPVLMTLHKDHGATHRLPMMGKEQFSTHVKAVNFLLESYATSSNIVKAESDIICMKKASIETSVQFSDVLQSKVVRGGNVYPEERTKRLFIDNLPTNNQSVVRIFLRT